MKLTDQNIHKKYHHPIDLLHYVISHARSSIAVHDRNLIYLYVSKRYLEEYRVKEKNIIGKHHYEVFPDLPQKWRDVHQRSLKGEIITGEDDSYLREDGSVDWTRWECRPWFELNGTIGGIIIYTEIINKQKETEEKIRQFGHIVSSSNDMMALVDNEFRFITANKSYLNAFNAVNEQISGKKVSDILGEDFFKKYIKHNAIRCLQGEVVRFQNWTDLPAHGESFMDITYSPYFDKDNKIKGYAVSARNITERKKAEDELKKHHDHLEEMVAERTSNLNALVKAMAGREIRMAELKEVIEELRRQLQDAGMTPVADDPQKLPPKF